MFNPLDFLQVASRLASSPDEATTRTCVSRAYYAAFLHAREELKARGCLFAGTGEDHNKVQTYLKKYIERGVGDQLGSLKRRREGADYDVAKAFNPSDVTDAIKLAQKIIKRL